ncbi:hypothetical protein BC940DRAFT_322967 [Gongronella butleri]|nr:hypothetical protein BC940DRAFT_322967 [Gongronella butleri]
MEFGDDAHVVVSKIMENGHATADGLVLSTGMLRTKVDEALAVLFKHNVCIIEEAAQQQTDDDRPSFSIDMNAALARPSKKSFVNFITIWGEKSQDGTDIIKAIVENGRMTLAQMVMKGLDADGKESFRCPICMEMEASHYLQRVPAQLTSEELDESLDKVLVNGQWLPGTITFILNIKLFEANIRSMAVARIVGHLIGLDSSRFIVSIIHAANEGVTLEKIKEDWRMMCTIGLAMQDDEIDDYFTTTTMEIELERLISEDFATLTVRESDQEPVYKANLEQIRAKVIEQCLLENVTLTFGEEARQIARVLMDSDSATIDDIHQHTKLPKTNIWDNLLVAAKTGYVKPDTSIENANYDPADKRVWRICSDKIHMTALEEMYDLLMLLAHVDSNLSRVITYSYGVALVLRDMQPTAFL